jgi:cell division septation protein DedD
MEEREKGLSTSSLVLLFMLGVVVCAVFFSLGFLLGYRERSSSNTAEVERVTPTGDAPPAVNPPPAKGDTRVRQDANQVPTVFSAQRAEAESNQKSGKVDSGTKISPGEDTKVAAPVAAETTASVPGHESAKADVPAATGETRTGSGAALQVAALQNRQDAESLVKVLKERGYPVFIVSPEDAHANDNLFRVRVGPFTSRDEEEKTRQELETEGFKPFVKR